MAQPLSSLERITVKHVKLLTCLSLTRSSLTQHHTYCRSVARLSLRATLTTHACLYRGIPMATHSDTLKISQMNSCRRFAITFTTVSTCITFTTVQSNQFHTHATKAERAKWSTKDVYSNPLSVLEPLLLVPLFDEKDQIFKPSVEEIKKAQDAFRPERGRSIEPLKGVINFTDLPDTRLPEVAFIGASNVGKTSLIRSLFFNPPELRITVSKKPGHTKVVKIYKVNKAFCLVDMPGYGENMPPWYVESAEEYIMKRQQLVRTFLLIDGTTGLTEEDRVGIEMMEEFGRPYALVLTKVDLTTHHIILKNLIELKKERSSWMRGALPQPFLVSSKTGAGVAFLRAFVAYVTGNLKVEGL